MGSGFSILFDYDECVIRDNGLGQVVMKVSMAK